MTQTENIQMKDDRELKKCNLCGGYHEKNVTHGFIVKGKQKYICQECADTVHGLI